MFKMEQIVHDPIHGSYALPQNAWIIIDTPEFQRLRGIKQTGATSYVYPGAEHTRFQHCLGVAHLAFQFGELIKTRYPDIINDKLINLLCLAGLCHDLGHCSYSHLYDRFIIPMFTTTDSGDDVLKTHEEASVLILNEIYNRYEDKLGLTHDDISIIGKMILGKPYEVPTILQSIVTWTDDDHKNMFLFEVVSNARTGIDVDKFDYLKRDCHYCGIPCTFDPQRLMTFMSIDEQDNQKLINYNGRSDEIVKSMWNARDDLHRRVYQHRVVKCIDLMLLEMVKSCSEDFIDTENQTKLRDAHKKLDTYCLLTDYSLICLANKNSVAKDILDRINSRDLWKTIVKVTSSSLLDLVFTSMFIKVGAVRFEETYVYYVYYTGNTAQKLNSQFLIELIQQSKGGKIEFREKSNDSGLEDQIYELFQ
jgi:HD superfamily phosphohydrolase